MISIDDARKNGLPLLVTTIVKAEKELRKRTGGRPHSVIQMKKPACEQISQMDPSECLIVAGDLRRCCRSLRKRRQEIMAKLDGGTEVEDGPMEAELRRVKCGTKSIVRLVVRV